MQGKIAEEAAQVEAAPAAEARGEGSKWFDMAAIKAKAGAAVQAVSALWAKLCAWCASMWTAFIDWTTVLGSHVKNLLYKDSGRRS